MSTKITLKPFGEISIDQLVELIRIAETSERYEDMCSYVKQLVITKSSNKIDLDVEERNLLTVAYKNLVSSKRSSCRILNHGFDNVDEELMNKYKIEIENNLELICKEVLELLTKYLLPMVKDKNDEVQVFYLKMTGDYFRYLSEFRRDNKEYKDKSREFYGKALDIARKTLNPTHPTRLGLSLNFSVWYYEIAQEVDKACELAKESFDNAIKKLDLLNNNDYRDSTLIMQLLRDNLTLWTSEQMDDEE